MVKRVNAYEVQSLNTVDVTNYQQGDIFITNRSIGILAQGKIKTLETSKPNLTNYVTKEELKKILKKY